MSAWIDEKARFRHWCEMCEAPTWFHMFTNEYDEYAYYFCNICDNEKHTMENDDYSEGLHESAVPLEIESVAS